MEVNDCVRLQCSKRAEVNSSRVISVIPMGGTVAIISYLVAEDIPVQQLETPCQDFTLT